MNYKLQKPGEQPELVFKVHAHKMLLRPYIFHMVVKMFEYIALNLVLLHKSLMFVCR